MVQFCRDRDNSIENYFFVTQLYDGTRLSKVQ